MGNWQIDRNIWGFGDWFIAILGHWEMGIGDSTVWRSTQCPDAAMSQCPNRQMNTSISKLPIAH
jgi:hypothetical protein